MKKSVVSPILMLLVLAMILSSSFADEPEIFTGNAVLTTAPEAGLTARLTITINEYTSDEEIVEYFEILKTEGQEGLRKILEKVEKGWIVITGKAYETINLAHSRPVEGGRIIDILNTHSLRIVERTASNLVFSFIQLKIDENGEGEGSMLAGTKIGFDSEGRLFLENLYLAPITIRGVRQRK